MNEQKINLIKTVYGSNTYPKVIDIEFRELVPTAVETELTSIGVDQFFEEYERLFFEIPISGSINSHAYLVERSTQYLGGSIQDEEKRALIEEINALRQQLLELGQTYLTISNIT